VGKNVIKISVWAWAWFAILSCVFFACNDNEPIEKPKHLNINSECKKFMPKDGGKYGYEEWERLSKDFSACCKKYNSCWTILATATLLLVNLFQLEFPAVATVCQVHI